jgi:hypothetical protein
MPRDRPQAANVAPVAVAVAVAVADNAHAHVERSRAAIVVTDFWGPVVMIK